MPEEDRENLRADLAAFPGMIRRETEGLSFEQMAFADQRHGWAKWSIDLHVRHLAQVPCNLLYVNDAEALRREGYAFPPTAEPIARNRRAGIRLVLPEIAPARADLLEVLQSWSDFCCAILDRETAESLRRIRFHRYVDPEEKRPYDPHKRIEFTRRMARLSPSGFTEDPDRPGHFLVGLGVTLERIYWHMLAHIRNIQRIKGLMGLPAVLDLPRVGFLSVPEYYD